MVSAVSNNKDSFNEMSNCQAETLLFQVSYSNIIGLRSNCNEVDISQFLQSSSSADFAKSETKLDSSVLYDLTPDGCTLYILEVCVRAKN